MEFYKNMQSSESLVKSMFRKVFISETAKESEALANLCKSPFKVIKIEQEYKHVKNP